MLALNRMIKLSRSCLDIARDWSDSVQSVSYTHLFGFPYTACDVEKYGCVCRVLVIFTQTVYQAVEMCIRDSPHIKYKGIQAHS